MLEYLAAIFIFALACILWGLWSASVEGCGSCSERESSRLCCLFRPREEEKK